MFEGCLTSFEAADVAPRRPGRACAPGPALHNLPDRCRVADRTGVPARSGALRQAAPLVDAHPAGRHALRAPDGLRLAAPTARRPALANHPALEARTARLRRATPSLGDRAHLRLDRAMPPPCPRPRRHAEFRRRFLRPCRRHRPGQALDKSVMKRALTDCVGRRIAFQRAALPQLCGPRQPCGTPVVIDIRRTSPTPSGQRLSLCSRHQRPRDDRSRGRAG